MKPKLVPDGVDVETAINFKSFTKEFMKASAASKQKRKRSLRRSATLFRTLYQTAPRDFPLLYGALVRYCVLLMEKGVKVEEADLALLKKLKTDKKVPTLHKVQGYLVMSHVYLSRVDTLSAVRQINKLLTLTPTPEEMETTVLVATDRDGSIFTKCPFEMVFESDILGAQNVMTFATEPIPLTLVNCTSDTKTPNCYGRQDENVSETEKDLINKITLLNAINAHHKALTRCAQCQATRSGTLTLKKCGRCHQVCYCSSKCQKEAWKTHKKSCRKRGEFQNDILEIISVNSKPKRELTKVRCET